LFSLRARNIPTTVELAKQLRSSESRAGVSLRRRSWRFKTMHLQSIYRLARLLGAKPPTVEQVRK
jgi:hypothetical protein